MKIFFLLNASQKRKHWDYRTLAGHTARRAGWSAYFGQVERDSPQASERSLLQALQEGCRRVVVVGGDGTLHRTLNWLYSQKRLDTTEVAVVPAGTCNDFARALGLSPRRMEEAFRVACSDNARETDLGLMENELFINNAGFGRRPSGVVEAAPGRTPPQALASGRRARPLKTLQGFSPLQIHAEWEKGSIDGTFYMGMACNAPFFSKGLYFSKNIRVTDGLLNVFLVPAMPKWKLLPLLMMGRLGRPVRSRHIIVLRVQNLTVESSNDLWPQADGEAPLKRTRKVTFTMAPEKARMIVPSRGKPVLIFRQL